MRVRSLKILAFVLVSGGSACPALGRVIQLTGLNRATRTTDFADPSEPRFTKDEVSILVTGGRRLVWRKSNAISGEKRFFSGESPEIEPIRICHRDGTEISEDFGEDIWDPTMHGNFLYGSIMTPTSGNQHAIWPADAASRRVYPFRLLSECWTRSETPLVAAWNNDGWVNHNYGHSFLKADDGREWVFYERVNDDTGNLPLKTALFAKILRTPERTDENETSIFDFKLGQWPTLARENGGVLAEGPRPFKFANGYLISFSGGDYWSNSYGIHLLWSKNINGPYAPFTTPDGRDLKDFGATLRQTLNLTWGPARAVFFERRGRWYALFHAVKKPFNPKVQEGYRQLFLAEVTIESSSGQAPQITFSAEQASKSSTSAPPP